MNFVSICMYVYNWYVVCVSAWGVYTRELCVYMNACTVENSVVKRFDCNYVYRPMTSYIKGTAWAVNRLLPKSWAVTCVSAQIVITINFYH